MLKRVKEKVKSTYFLIAEKKKEALKAKKSLLSPSAVARAGSKTIGGSRGHRRNNTDLAGITLPDINKKAYATTTRANEAPAKISFNNVKSSAISIMKKKQHWLNFLDEEHADAIISDAFWYIICKICNPKAEFEQH